MSSFLFGNLLTVFHEFPKNYTSEPLPRARARFLQALKRLFVEIKHFQLLGARHDEILSFFKIILKPGVWHMSVIPERKRPRQEECHRRKDRDFASKKKKVASD